MALKRVKRVLLLPVNPPPKKEEKTKGGGRHWPPSAVAVRLETSGTARKRQIRSMAFRARLCSTISKS